jgi:hypothetical protein
MTKKSRSGEYSDQNSVIKSIRWKRVEYEALEAIAKDKGLDFGVLVRDLTVAQLSNMAGQEELLQSFKATNPEEVQKNFFDLLNGSQEVLLKSVQNNNETLRKKVEYNELLIRGLMFLVIYFNREMDEAEKEGRAAHAKVRLNAFIESLEKEARKNG